MLNTKKGWTLGPLLLGLVLFWDMATAQALESRQWTLENGLETILVKESKAPVVITQVWYRVGASDEVAGKTGLAHMLEHMMFQGTETVGPSQFSEIIARHGGTDNASTALDYTNYWIKLASDQLPLALKLEADRMRHLQLQASEFGSENQVVQEERRSRTDNNPSARFREQFNKVAFAGTPYGRPVIGSMEDIQNQSLADLQQWYREHYSPDQAVLVVVGDIELEAAQQMVIDAFSGVERGETKSRPPLPPLPEPKETVRMEVTDARAPLPLFQAGFPVPTFMTGPLKEAFALEVLSNLLGGSASSRIYHQLVVKEGKAVSAGSGYGGLSRGMELFTLSGVPRPGITLSQLEEALFAEVDRLIHQPIEDRELQRAKNGLIADHLFAQDSVDHIAWLIGRTRANQQDWRLLVEEYPAGIQAVTAREIQQVAARYLQKRRATIGTLHP